MSKPRVIKNYHQLDLEVRQQIKLVYPKGFKKHLIPFQNIKGERLLGLPFETEEKYYLIRMTRDEAQALIAGDDDYNEKGYLKKSVKAAYEDKFDDLDYLGINSNEDNDLVDPDEEGDIDFDEFEDTDLNEEEED